MVGILLKREDKAMNVNARNLLALAVACAPFGNVLAEENSQSLILEEVIVTAQKRAQSLQDVPISVVAFGSDQLAAGGIDELTDISASVPNLVVNSFNSDPSAVRLFIRGIGQNDVQLTQDPSVALYLDGVYIGSSFGAGFEGVDVERLEVLRGPQGTLYGRNATGGAVNIITKRASTEGLEFQQDFTTGNLGAFKSRTMINVPLSETVAAKINYLISQRDGYVENQGPGADFGEEDRSSAVVDLRWNVSDTMTVDYRYEQADMADSQRLQQVRSTNTTGVLAALTSHTAVSLDSLDTVTSLREIESNDLEIKAHTINLDLALSDELTLKSITAQRKFDNKAFSDVLSTSEGNGLLYTGAPTTTNFATGFEQFSQEFQLIGSTEQLEYVAGLYYYEDEGNSDAATSVTLGSLAGTDATTTENTSLALFGEATYTPDAMDQRWRITLGARGSKDNRKATRTNLNIVGAPIIDGKYDKDFTNFNPSMTVSFDIDDSMNVYGKVVSGFKSGGTSQRSANAALFNEGFAEEEVLSYEAGFKGDLWDGRARLNVAVFSMDIDGAQTSVQTGLSPAERDFLPVDGNSIDGFEADLTLLLSEGLTMNLGYGYLDAKHGASSVISPVGTFQLTESYPYAPETSYNIGLDYQTSLSNGELSLSLAYNYQDERNSSPNLTDNVVLIDYGLWNASASLRDIRMTQVDGSFKLLAWVKNITDEEYTVTSTQAWGAFGAAEVATFGDPRTVGLTLSYIYE